mmetsp:Transcript_37089/g.42316  ORF Transcript_37089/g.42316 Transcript_37089/m.42316 type:complete len:145 (+) Transcript_37089:98-532(+)
MSFNKTINCDKYTRRKEKCMHRFTAVEAKEKCCVAELQEKKCHAFQRCTAEAQAYYGVDDFNPHPYADKSFCAAFDESYCFGNPRVMKIDEGDEDGTPSSSVTNSETVFQYHLKSKRKMINNRKRYIDCQGLSNRLNRCLKKFS